MKISQGIKEDGIVIGNNYDKYGSKNPIVKKIMNGFDNTLSNLIDKTNAKQIHEIGCGEGYWVMKWLSQGIDARGSDFSKQVIGIAKSNALAKQLPTDIFKQMSIYDADKENDTAELIICCEVLEHLEFPEMGLEALQKITEKYIILSVPREPIWCTLNLLRGKYISRLGNTPGHIQHWSSRSFIKLIAKYFDIIEVEKPFPWTMLLCKKK